MLLLIAVAGCSDPPAEEREGEASPPFSYSIDPELEPSRAEHPRPGETSAPLVALETSVGVAEMVANELLVQPRDDDELEQIKAQLDAEVVTRLAGDSTQPRYLLRINSEKASLDTFVEDMRAVSEGGDHMGEVTFSSEEGARTMAAAAALHRQGITADVTWVGKPASIETMSTTEAPNGWERRGTNFGNDAYAWPYFSATSTQGTGVGEAWSILDRTGRLGNKVQMAVIDAGFCPNDDFHDSVIYDLAPGVEDGVDSVSPLVFGTGACSWTDWSALSTSGWHGTHVYSAMMGVHDNGFGSTGPGSPVVQTPTRMVHMMYDTVTTLFALEMVESDGVQIANMSFHIPIPYGFQWTHEGYNSMMGSFFDDDGLLMFASAGNDGEDVDEQLTVTVLLADGFKEVGVGEKWQLMPCEADGVICVAGVAHDSTSRDGGSNFGSNSVDIAGPYTVAAGPDKDEPANALSTINGTSFASPYVAGVAALIWAADPSLSATEVRDILYETSLPGDYGDDVRNGYACALCAIRSIIPNSPPVIELISPQAGSSIPEGEEINFEVSVTDVEDIVLGETTQVTWYEGTQELHQGESFSAHLCPGTHHLRVEAIDSDGVSVSKEFEIESVAAELAIGGPRLRDYRVKQLNNGTLYADDVQLGASAPATCTHPDRLTESGIEWRDESGVLLGTGTSLTIAGSDLQNDDGNFISKEIAAEFELEGVTYTDQIILSPCATDGSYAECSTSAIIGDMLESLADAFGDGAWEDPERQADLIAREIYSDPLESLGLCSPEECDPVFPRLTDPIMGDLWGNYSENSVYGLQQMLQAAQEGDVVRFDAATAQARDALGRMDGARQEDKDLLQYGVAVGAALAEFYLPESAGGQNGWSDMTFVTDPENMTRAQAMRPVEAGLRGFLDATTITGDPTSELNVAAAEYSSVEEAITVADELP